MTKYFVLIGVVFFAACNSNTTDPTSDTPGTSATGLASPTMLHAAVMGEYPHDTNAFTEGLLVHNGKLYEGTGETKNTFIQVTDIKTGKVEKKYPVKDSTIFGEGINIFKDKLYQLTYQNHLVLVYDVKDLSKPIKTFPWNTEGWGITNNGTELIISDGQASGNLYFVNPGNFTTNRIVQVVDNYGPVNAINELEYIDGSVFANIWGTTHIIKIDPANGHVIGKLETADILKSFYSTYPIRELDNVLNGIAYDSTSKKMYITGKRWPKLFELKMN